MYIKDIMKSAAKEVFQDEINELKHAIVNNSIETLRDMVLNIAGGKSSFDEFAKRIITYVDAKVEEAKNNKGLSYVTGKIIFENIPQKSHKVLISYELYFIDTNKKIIKSGANCEVPSSQFKEEALLELNNIGKIEYEVEE